MDGLSRLPLDECRDQQDLECEVAFTVDDIIRNNECIGNTSVGLSEGMWKEAMIKDHDLCKVAEW